MKILPCYSVFNDSLSSGDKGVLIIAGTAFTGHTLSLFVHVGSLSTATAVHRGKADLAGEICQAEGAACPTAGGHVVIINCLLWTWLAKFSCVIKKRKTSWNTLIYHAGCCVSMFSDVSLTTDGFSPASDMDSCCWAGVDIRRHCSTHALFTFLTVTAVVHAVLLKHIADMDESMMVKWL